MTKSFCYTNFFTAFQFTPVFQPHPFQYNPFHSPQFLAHAFVDCLRKRQKEDLVLALSPVERNRVSLN